MVNCATNLNWFHFIKRVIEKMILMMIIYFIQKSINFKVIVKSSITQSIPFTIFLILPPLSLSLSLLFRFPLSWLFLFHFYFTDARVNTPQLSSSFLQTIRLQEIKVHQIDCWYVYHIYWYLFYFPKLLILWHVTLMTAAVANFEPTLYQRKQSIEYVISSFAVIVELGWLESRLSIKIITRIIKSSFSFAKRTKQLNSTSSFHNC